jgi:hypothetical protein
MQYVGFSSSTASTLAVRYMQAPIRWLTRTPFLESHRPEPEAGHLSPYNAEVKNALSYTAISLYTLLARELYVFTLFYIYLYVHATEILLLYIACHCTYFYRNLLSILPLRGLLRLVNQRRNLGNRAYVFKLRSSAYICAIFRASKVGFVSLCGVSWNGLSFRLDEVEMHELRGVAFFIVRSACCVLWQKAASRSVIKDRELSHVISSRFEESCQLRCKNARPGCRGVFM